ncbi:exported protein (hyp5, exported protein family 4) [Plasmodium gaboni]|uniref:Exported protein (Hyp5, exported protein family 4) n=1 Tax=Plasmodium gaboni TaxID=647221 RepID=A0A151L2W6_9APIC|nr:exported protein (hyp5, exported protein family 4) [Plasmodium gaboni]KYN93197.1 exported protein (hyp5, exported protein family 4) [Plasmodium gaboni]
MTFFYVRILNVAIVICLCLFNYKDNATKWKKEIQCCKNNLNFLSFKRCLLQHVVEENIERKGSSVVLLKEKKNEQGRKKKIKKTKRIKPKNENNKNNIVLKNLSDKEINEQENMTNERVENNNINDKEVENNNINDKEFDNISNNIKMEEKYIICKDINSNEINDNQKIQEIKEKLVKDLLKNKNKEIIKKIEIINSDGTMTKIKNSLYSLIFKGVNFWKGLAIYIGALSGAAIAQVILTFILKFAIIYSWSALATYSFISTIIASSSFVGLIILTIIGVIFLLMWLWPSRGKLMGHNNREDKSDT